MTVHIEYHVNKDTLEARHCLVSRADCLRFHAAFTPADFAAGWSQVKAEHEEGMAPSDIEAEKRRLVDFQRHYWREYLAARPVDQRVVHKGRHFVIHELGTSLGFGGQAFRVEWFDKTRLPTVCNLSGQGDVPAWIRSELPDNAVVFTQDLEASWVPVPGAERVG